MLTVSETRSPHQRKSAVLASPASILRMRRQHLRRALVRDNQQLELAPASQLLARPQPVGHRSLHLVQHGLAGHDAVGLAQLAGLVDGDPQHAERQAARAKILMQGCQPVFQIDLALFDFRVVATFPVGQRIQALGRMKDHGGAQMSAQSVAQGTRCAPSPARCGPACGWRAPAFRGRFAAFHRIG